MAATDTSITISFLIFSVFDILCRCGCSRFSKAFARGDVVMVKGAIVASAQDLFQISSLNCLPSIHKRRALGRLHAGTLGCFYGPCHSQLQLPLKKEFCCQILTSQAMLSMENLKTEQNNSKEKPKPKNPSNASILFQVLHRTLYARIYEVSEDSGTFFPHHREAPYISTKSCSAGNLNVDYPWWAYGITKVAMYLSLRSCLILLYILTWKKISHSVQWRLFLKQKV